MTDVIDLESCYDAMLTLQEVKRRRLISKAEYDEDMLGIRVIKRRVIRELVEQKRDSEDNFNPADHRIG